MANVPIFAAEPVSIFYYDHEYQLGTSWNNAVEQIAASSSSIKMVQAATETTYTNGAKYLLNVPEGLTLDELNATTDYEFDQRIEVLEYGNSFIIPSRRSDFNLFSGGLEEISQLLKADFIPAELFYGISPSGIRFPVVYIPSRREQKLWYAAYRLDHQLSINGENVLFTTVSEPSGLDVPTVDMVEEASRKNSNVLVSIGAGSNIPGDFARTAQFIADADTDIVALDADDLFHFWQEIESGKIRTSLADPDYVMSNAEVKGTRLERVVKKYATRRFGRRNIAFLSIAPVSSEENARLKKAGMVLKDPKSGNFLSRLVDEIKQKSRPDLVVAVSFLPKSDEGWLASAAGIDIVIGPKTWNYSSPVRTRVDFSSREAGNRSGPVLFVYPDAKGAGTIRCELTRNGRLDAIESISARDDRSLPFRQEIRNAMKQEMMNSLISGEPLLPDPRNISINGNSPSRFYYTPDFYNAAVSMLRKRYRKELAMLRVRGSASNILGDVPDSVIRTWLGPDEPLKTAEIPGSLVKKILSKKAPAANADNWSPANYIGKEYYALSGLDSGNSVAGLAIQKDEYYTVVLPNSMIEGEPSVKNVRDTGETVHSAVISCLKDLGRNSEKRADWEQSVRDEIDNKVEQRSLWRLNIRNLSLYASNFGSTGQGKGFGNVGESRLSTENQNNIRGSANIVSEFYYGPYRADLSVYADYGKSVYPSYTSESTDNLLFEGQGTYRWRTFNGKLGALSLGPFASAGWETEFTRNKDSNRRRILRGKGGMKLFEGNYIKEFYAGMTLEQNYTDSPYYTKFAAETGYRFEFKIPKTTFLLSSNGSYRRFARSHNDTRSDLLDRLEINATLSTSLYKNLSLDIFAKWLYATGKKIPGFGSSTETGASISYKQLFKLKK